MGRRFEIERSGWVDAPPRAVYEHVADLRRWPSWMPWEGMDPTIERRHDGSRIGAGARTTWSGGRLSTVGYVEVTDATPGRRVACTMVSERPVRTRCETVFLLHPSRGGTLVTWRMVGPRSRATGIVLGLRGSIDRVVGSQFEEGLRRLRIEVESSVAATSDAGAA